MIQYTIPVYARMEQAMPSIGKIIDEVNDTMAGFGFHEKIGLKGVIANLMITSPVPLTREQALAYLKSAQEVFDEKLDFEVWLAEFNEWLIEEV